MIAAPSERETWLTTRRSGLGSSDIAAILGQDPFRSPFAVYADKVGDVEPEDVSDKPAVLTGIALEPVVATLYEKKTGRTLVDHGRFAVRRHPDYPMFLATIDREIVGPGERGILEAKASEYEWPDDEPPLRYQLQLAWQMFVLGHSWGSVAAILRRHRFTYKDIELSKNVAEMLAREATAFWQRVERREPPTPDATEATADAIRRLYPASSGRTISLPHDLGEADREYETICEQLDALEIRKREIENRVKVALADAETGTLPTGAVWSFRTIKRKGYVVKDVEYRQLRRRLV